MEGFKAIAFAICLVMCALTTIATPAAFFGSISDGKPFYEVIAVTLFFGATAVATGKAAFELTE